MKKDEMVIKKVMKYIDTLVTIINPGLNDPIPKQHPCQKPKNELRDDQLDYINLINKVQ